MADKTRDSIGSNSANYHHDYLEFTDLQDSLKIKNKELFMVYIKEVFKDLAERDEGNKKKGIPKITFFEFLKVPIFISESIFISFDTNKDGYLSLSEFGEGLTLLYLGSFEEVVHLIFNIYDSNQDGFIHKEDIRLMLSYLPLKEDNSVTAYNNQLESQEEIQEIVASTFQDKNELNFIEYLKVVESRKSDSFVQLLCYLYEKKVFNETNLQLLENNKDIQSKLKNLGSIKQNDFYSPQIKRRIPSPRKASVLSPLTNYLRKKSVAESGDIIKLYNIQQAESTETYEVSPNSDANQVKIPETSAYEGMIRMPNMKIANQGDDFNKVINSSTNNFDSPSNFLRRLAPKKKEFSILSNLVKISNDETTDKHHNFDLLKNSKSINSIELVAMEGWIYKITENNKLKKYWLVVNNTDIFYYKNEKKEELSGMHNLSGCHIKEAQPTTIGSTKLFSFIITFQNKNRTYYCTDREQSIGWINRLRKAIGYESFFDYYEIIDDIGQGKFGVVKLGVHKNTKLRVAIKTIKKENLKNKQDQELVKTEIDIMKLCRHPNIVNLLDHFENSEYIFIVMEYIQGGDLTKYVNKYYGGKNNKTLPEKKVAELMKQLASGLEYLHRYGIIHRDLKPDNIMMTEKSINAEIKIMDFGLSKMMHHGEKVADGFGTLSFVAPEVLVRKPYNSKVDVWSLGITIYHLLSGELPFDDANDNEEIIARKVVFSEVEFTSKIWEKISKSAKNIIRECLVKDQDKRITISQFLDNEWIKTNIS